MTLHQLYLRHGTAFDCAKLAQEMSTPEHGVSEFEAFCKIWPRVCALLEAPAEVYISRTGKRWRKVDSDSLWLMLTVVIERELWANGYNVRVVLLDGTVIREWPGAT
jgi:hypothetical protein